MRIEFMQMVNLDRTVKIGASLILGMTLAAFGTGCVDNKLRMDVQRISSDFEDSRGFQAEQTTKISSLESEVRRISGRLDELDFQQNQKLGIALNSLKSDLTSLKRRVPPPPIVPVADLEADEAALTTFPAELAGPMNDAFIAMREGGFDRALLTLEDAMGLAIDTEWAPMVLYWKGIASEGENKPRDALEYYLAISSQHGKSARAPAALLRQGSVLIRIGDKKTAKLVFNKLIADFPKSTEAGRAQDRLKDLGK